jgi:transcriptional regulator GlxA family with amidase domain
MQIAILLFEGLTALDAVGPYEALSRIPDAQTVFVAEQAGPKRTGDGVLALTADATLDEVSAPDVLLIPGGVGRERLLQDGPVHEWLRAAHETSTWTTSVCTGSLVLASAGLLAGRQATTHWASLERLRSLGAEPVTQRTVFDGKLVTAAGVSAGIDMALELIARECGSDVAQEIQLSIEYDPEPPFDAGSPAKAPAQVLEAVAARYAARRAPAREPS